jgi:AcrR family transcriptional regulator
MGRPREFDVDEALATALDQFWRKGFEGTSVNDLTEAMGITKPSLYATFGNKEELFRKALDRYQSTCMTFVEEALAEPAAFQVVERLLYGYATCQTDGAHPPGCLDTNGALVCSEAAEPVRRELIARRTAQEAALRRRLEHALETGDLPADSDPADLARYVMAVIQGMAVQAASGASRETLHGVVRTALRAWPST